MNLVKHSCEFIEKMSRGLSDDLEELLLLLDSGVLLSLLAASATFFSIMVDKGSKPNNPAPQA
jgi:hypothetical protein